MTREEKIVGVAVLFLVGLLIGALLLFPLPNIPKSYGNREPVFHA